MIYVRLSLIVLGTSLLPGCGDKPAEETIAAAAAVAMPDSQSAKVASDVLNAGGNAIDVAVAAGFALAVSEPEAGNIGGGGFMVIYYEGEAYFLDYRETAPLAAHRDMYLDEDGEVIEGLSTRGHLSVGVPGAVAGLWTAHQRFGSLPWKDLVMPAVRLARDGFIAHPQLADEIHDELPFYEGKTNFANYFGPVCAVAAK